MVVNNSLAKLFKQFAIRKSFKVSYITIPYKRCFNESLTGLVFTVNVFWGLHDDTSQY